MLGYPIDVKEASEPTDIIWENRFFTPKQRQIKSFIVSIIIGVLLGISFVVIYICQKNSLALKNKYPKLNCREFAENYVGKRELFQKEAINEYLHNLNAVEFHFTGPLQCFCQQERVNKMPSTTNYKLLGMRGNVIYDGPICQQYFSDILMSKLMGQSIAFIIIAVNIILKIVIIQLVIWIGEDTTS